MFKKLLLLALTIAVYGYNNSKLSPGVYKEEISECKIIASHWNLLIKLDISLLERKINELDTLREDINRFCGINKLDCTQWEAISFKMIQKAYVGNENLKLILRNRSKRGLINIIGSAANFMFGTLDQEDKENLENQIRNLDNKSDLEFLKKQTKIMSSTLIELENNREMINNHTKIINEIIKSEGKELDRHSSQIHALRMENLFKLFYDLVLDEISNIERGIVDMQHGVLNPNIISYQKIIEELKDVIMHNPTNNILPVHLENPDISLLNKIIKMGILVEGKILYFVIKVPLILNEEYKIIKLYPIPEQHGNNFINYKIENNVFLINSIKNKYLPLSEKMLEDNCIKNNNYFCNINVIHKNKINECGLALILEEKVKENCKKVVFKLQDIFFEKINKPGSYICMSPKLVKGIYKCKDSENTINFKGISIFEGDNECSLYLPNLEIRFPKTLKVITKGIELIQNYTVKTESENKILEKIKENVIDLIPENKMLNVNKLHEIGKDIENLNEELNLKTERENWKNLHLSVSGVTTSILFFIIIIYIYKKYKAYKTKLESKNKEKEEKILKKKTKKPKNKKKDLEIEEV